VPHQRWRFERLRSAFNFLLLHWATDETFNSNDTGEESQQLSREIASKNQQLKERDAQLVDKDHQLAEKDQELAQIKK
jgi:uncharacterized protein (DUF3084 family)